MDGETSFGADYTNNLKLITNIYFGLLPAQGRNEIVEMCTKHAVWYKTFYQIKFIQV